MQVIGGNSHGKYVQGKKHFVAGQPQSESKCGRPVVSRSVCFLLFRLPCSPGVFKLKLDMQLLQNSVFRGYEMLGWCEHLM